MGTNLKIIVITMEYALWKDCASRNKERRRRRKGSMALVRSYRFICSIKILFILKYRGNTKSFWKFIKTLWFEGKIITLCFLNERTNIEIWSNRSSNDAFNIASSKKWWKVKQKKWSTAFPLPDRENRPFQVKCKQKLWFLVSCALSLPDGNISRCNTWHCDFNLFTAIF